METSTLSVQGPGCDGTSGGPLSARGLSDTSPRTSWSSPQTLADDEVSYIRRQVASISHGKVILKIEEGVVVSVDTERRTRVRLAPADPTT
jgi:hypothetical protein